MSSQFVQFGNVYSYVSTGATAVTKDTVFVSDQLVGVITNSVVANTDASWSSLEDTQKTVVVALEGVYNVEANAEVFAVGNKVYADAVTNKATLLPNAGANPYMGIAVSTIASSRVKVNLNI